MPPDSPSTSRSKPACCSCARMKPTMMRRALSVSMASSGGSSNAGPSGPRSLDAASWPRPRRRSRRRGRARCGRAGAAPPPVARHAAAGCVMRSRRSSAGSISAKNRPSSWSGAWYTLAPDGPHDLGAAPEADGLVDAHPVHEHDVARRQLGVGPVQRAPRGGRAQPFLAARGDVPTGRRRDVDEHLGAVERQQLGRRKVPEVLAHGDAQAEPEPAVRRPG